MECMHISMLCTPLSALVAPHFSVFCRSSTGANSSEPPDVHRRHRLHIHLGSPHHPLYPASPLYFNLVHKLNMVLGLLVIAGIPTTIGVAEGISQSKKQKKEQEDERYLERFTLETFCEGSSRRASELHKKPVVLRDGKVR